MEVTTLADLPREAEEHQGAYEATAPPHHWADWYVPYVIAREEAAPRSRPPPKPGAGPWGPAGRGAVTRDGAAAPRRDP
jgi:hypothetical protein